MIEVLAALIGRHVHYWAPQAPPQHVRHDEVPFHARIVFVHPDGDVSVRGADHYGATFIDTHVRVVSVDALNLEAFDAGEMRHGSPALARGGLCTWPVIVHASVSPPPQQPADPHVVTAAPAYSDPLASANVGTLICPEDHMPCVRACDPGGTCKSRSVTEGEKRAALELANIKQAAEDSKEQRWQPQPVRTAN